MQSQPNFIQKLQTYNTNKKFLKVVFALSIVTVLLMLTLCFNLVKLNTVPTDLDEVFSTLASITSNISYSLKLLYFMLFISIVSISLIIFNYYQTKEKLSEPYILLSLISNGILIIFFMFNFKALNSINNLLKNLKSGNFFSSLFDAGSVKNLDSLPNIKSIISIVIIIIILQLLAIVTSYFKLYKDTDILSKNKLCAIKEKVRKVDKKVIISTALLIICIFSFLIYKAFIYKKNVDIMSNITLKFDGLSGRGSAKLEGSPESTNDAQINKLLKTVDFKVSKSNNLKNGDTVSVTADYDLDLAKKYKLKISTVKKDFKVEGLNVLASDIKDLSKDVIDKIKNDTFKNINSSYSDRKNLTVKYLDTYYKNSDNKSSHSLSLIFLYTVEYDYTDFFNATTRSINVLAEGGDEIILDPSNTLVKYDKDYVSSFWGEKDADAKRKELESKGYIKLQ